MLCDKLSENGNPGHVQFLKLALPIPKFLFGVRSAHFAFYVFSVLGKRTDNINIKRRRHHKITIGAKRRAYKMHRLRSYLSFYQFHKS